MLFIDNVNKSISEDTGLQRLNHIPGAVIITSRQASFSDEFELYRIGFLNKVPFLVIICDLVLFILLYRYVAALSKTPHIQYLCRFARHGNFFYHSQNLWFCIYSNNQLKVV